MCGIIIVKDKSKIDSIEHRGLEYSEKTHDGFVYGHHRLPIQTLEKDKWSQPIEIPDGFFLFNGEIFNYDKEKFDNDVEYIQHCFRKIKKFGGFIDKMNEWDGFWSFVIRNQKDKYKLVFTDPLGKKQLYYNSEGEISSEIKKLSNNEIIDTIYISCVRKWGYNTDNRTIYTDVKRIMPNNLYMFQDHDLGNPIILYQGYYDWNKNIPDKSIHDLIEDSVKRRLISKKYKVSTLFSGGLDSTIILYFLRKMNVDINIYSIDNGVDGNMVKLMEKKWNLDINYLNPEITNISHEDKMKIYDINDGPIDLGSAIPQYYLFKDIKDKIVLTGDGADELFGGYSRISKYDSQGSDVFEELPFYHLIRLDRMSMNFTIEQRSPFLGHDVIKKALQLSYSERMQKKHLKDQFKGLIPNEILNRKKEPLKIVSIRENEIEYRENIIDQYLEYLKLK